MPTRAVQKKYRHAAASIQHPFGSMVQDVEKAYQKNPYHNSCHAADVVQGLACMFANNAFTAQLTDLEMLSMILACAIHDVGHPGATCLPPCCLQMPQIVVATDGPYLLTCSRKEGSAFEKGLLAH